MCDGDSHGASVRDGPGVEGIVGRYGGCNVGSLEGPVVGAIDGPGNGAQAVDAIGFFVVN